MAEEIIENFKFEINASPCSQKHHLNRVGGLKKHLYNVFYEACHYFERDDQLKFLALIHDIGKARVYKWGGEKGSEIMFRKPDVDHILHTINMLNEFGLELTNDELNALQFHHGGYSNFKGNMNELAIKLHFCDMMATLKESNVNES